MQTNFVTNEEVARDFCEAIRTISTKPKNIKNLEYYLSSHFDKWLERFANTPANLAAELKEFANMEI